MTRSSGALLRRFSGVLVGVGLSISLLAGCGGSAGGDATPSANVVTPSPIDTTLPTLPEVNPDMDEQVDESQVTAALTGLSVTDAQAKAAASGYSTRIVSVDGDNRPVTMDYRTDRINLTVVNDQVTQASVG